MLAGNSLQGRTKRNDQFSTNMPMTAILQNTGKDKGHMVWVKNKKVELPLFHSSTQFNYEGDWRIWRDREIQDLFLQGKEDRELCKYPWKEAYAEGVVKDRSRTTNRCGWRSWWGWGRDRGPEPTEIIALCLMVAQKGNGCNRGSGFLEEAIRTSSGACEEEYKIISWSRE